MDDEARLPKWAQARLRDLRIEIKDLESALHRANMAHEVLTGREWFSIPGPPEEGEWRGLWVLKADDARKICSLGKGDVLIVGRNRGL